MRDFLLVYVNGQRHEIRGGDAFLSLSQFLRCRLGLTGTKIVCNEGDCGACTVLIGRVVAPTAGQRDRVLRYHSIDACIHIMFQLDGTHIVTVEALADNGQLTQVQKAMVDGHGSQCGFCTPGFITSMTGMMEEESQLSEAQLRYGLSGNICRCTGYAQIVESGRNVSAAEPWRLDVRFPPADIVRDLSSVAKKEIALRGIREGGEQLLYSPVELGQALSFLSTHPAAQVIAGATDIGPRIHKSFQLAPIVVDLNRLAALDSIEVADGHLVLGARTTWTAIKAACRETIPQFHQLLSRFGSPQIRNVGTIGGNLVNASPTADSLPLLMVMDAQLELCSAASTRTVNINQFYLDYKELDLLPGELLTKIRLPLPGSGDNLRLYKVSRRHDLDIASFSAAVSMMLQGGQIRRANIALGAVGPTVIRPRQAEDFLAGQPFTVAVMRQAGEIAAREITPISDVRGSAEYRLQLTRNILLKYYHDLP